MEEILELARKVSDHAEVFRVSSIRTPVQFEANRLKQILTKETTGTALRLFKNGRIGFAQASGNILARDLVDMALETCPFGQEAIFDLPEAQSYHDVEILDPRVNEVNLDDMISSGQSIIDKVRAHTPDVLCEASVSTNIVTCRIMNTRGCYATYKKSSYGIGVEGMLVRDDDILYVGDSQGSCHPDINLDMIADEVIRQLELARRKASFPSGMTPVVFTPFGVAGSLLTPLLSALNGKTVFDGASPLKEKRGLKVLDGKFTLWDDPHIPFQPGSTPFDDEGIPARRHALIQGGTINLFYYDLHTAALARTHSTGNGSRSGGMPSPSSHQLIIEGGDSSPSSMIKDIKEGIVVEMLMGAEQGNILNGDFSGNVLLGFKIENGEVVGRVKDTMVHANVYELLKDIIALGNDARWIGGAVKVPSIYCPSISVSAK